MTKMIEMQEPIDLANAGLEPCQICFDYDTFNCKCDQRDRCYCWNVYQEKRKKGDGK